MATQEGAGVGPAEEECESAVAETILQFTSMIDMMKQSSISDYNMSQLKVTIDDMSYKTFHCICAAKESINVEFAARAGRVPCGNQISNPTSMCAYSKALTRALPLRFDSSTRAIDSSKNQPNRLRFDRAREF